MAGTGTEVITGRLLDVAKDVEEIIGRYNTSVNKMYQIGGELDATWDGEASQKFAARFGNDRQQFDALTKMLTTYVDVLRQDAAIYVNAENEAINAVNKR